MTKTYYTNPLNEDNLQWKKTSKVKYLRICLLDHTPILNLDLGDQSHRKQPQNIKSGTSQHHLLDPTQILN
jgi:hypothetical protein